jgi:hypothetical protein
VRLLEKRASQEVLLLGLRVSRDVDLLENEGLFVAHASDVCESLSVPGELRPARTAWVGADDSLRLSRCQIPSINRIDALMHVYHKLENSRFSISA